MTMLKRSSLTRSGGIWSQRSAINKWPVDEIGRNSVIPSIIPKIIAAIQSGIRWLDAKLVRLTSGKMAARLEILPRDPCVIKRCCDGQAFGKFLLGGTRATARKPRM